MLYKLFVLMVETYQSSEINTIPCIYTAALSLSDSELMTGYIVWICREGLIESWANGGEYTENNEQCLECKLSLTNSCQLLHGLPFSTLIVSESTAL